MGIPDPIHPLHDHCSVILDDTLYVYSPAGFQSLQLKVGAKWNDLPMDISLTGAQCVLAASGGDANGAMLYVVGGSVNQTAATWNYPGLMHYSFAGKKWDWVRPTDWVTQNRQNHAAIYLEDSKQILVYSGSQTTANTDLSSSTFLISTTEPFQVDGRPSNGAPPSVKPMLMPWNNTNAVMFGGSADNQAVFLFSAGLGWRNLGVTLTEPIAHPEQVQCTLVSGTDGSKVLEKYDMSVTPNKVTRVALLNQGGTVAAPGTIIGDKSKRVTISGWPAYNGTLAPTATRTGYSIAQNDKNLAVITGGSDQDPLCIFNQEANSWVNATELFEGPQVVIQSTPSSAAAISSTTIPSSTTPSASATSSAAAVIPPPAPVDNKTRMLTVLGATLGAIFGIAALLVLLLFCLKYRKSKNRKVQQTGYVEKDRLSFADRGADYMKEAGGSIRQNHYHSTNASQSSLAIVSGQVGNNHKRGLGPLGSDASMAGLVTKKSPLGYSEPVELSKFDLKPEPIQPINEDKIMVRQNSSRQPPRVAANASRSRSSGWSRYFANNEATNLANMPSGRSTYASDRTSTGSQSLYTDSRMYGRPSQNIPPLEIPKFDNQRLSKVQTGSPTLGHSHENLPAQAMQAELGRANSDASARSGVSRDDYYSRVPVESWTPVGDDRPPSSNYTNSVVYENNNRDGASTYYPDGASSFYPKSNISSFYPGQPPTIGAHEDRQSTVTIFPGARNNRDTTGQPDMSWLNLGTGK